MIEAVELKITYDKNTVVDEFSLLINKGEVLSLIGPNGSGKSTVLNTISRLLKQTSGAVLLDGQDIHLLPTREVAKKLSVLSQHQATPPDFTVRELVGYGRMPHKRWYEEKTFEDEEIICWAIEQTRLEGLSDRMVNTLSGGERQRAWIAMALAQRPEILLLDEPTTFLDICHQMEVMELIKRLNKELDITVVMVLHDLNQAARYSERLAVLNNGQLVAQGKAEDVLTRELLRDVYQVEADVKLDERTGKPVFVPIGLTYSC
ncbi:putative siderophore transport system ATP-binding protein YusV [Oxobacter pfennigii]|uniref:Putative siderophore transport system ATP-binding protein YusV n=1 Tax=Oxobacter pfennigii TaxID=36849 RepID=A0A0P8W9Q9_9CLOT|nr:ABC transporter ATP-binding protein [Oxobacter pfennigii]KPU44425.1 putative siderophore transport system ATP-binding protein YusV [Oxobacter pfennigii]